MKSLKYLIQRFPTDKVVEELRNTLEKAESQNVVVQRNYEQSQSENEKQKIEISALQEKIKQMMRKRRDDNYSSQQKIRKLQKDVYKLDSLQLLTMEQNHSVGVVLRELENEITDQIIAGDKSS